MVLVNSLKTGKHVFSFQNKQVKPCYVNYQLRAFSQISDNYQTTHENNGIDVE